MPFYTRENWVGRELMVEQKMAATDRAVEAMALARLAIRPLTSRCRANTRFSPEDTTVISVVRPTIIDVRVCVRARK